MATPILTRTYIDYRISLGLAKIFELSLIVLLDVKTINTHAGSQWDANPRLVPVIYKGVSVIIWGSQYFGFNITKKMVIVFGSCFNNMVVERFNSSGDQTELIKVPITYAAKEKMLARLQADPNLDRPYSALLPRMSFEIVDMFPNRTRHLPTLNRWVAKSTNLNKLKYQYTPVAYDIKFNLYIYTKNAQDGTKLLEQILPFFTPEWTASVELIAAMGETRDIPIILDGVSLQDLYDGDFKVRRSIVWTLSFTMQTYMYGPVKDKPIIKFTEVSMIMGDPSEDDLSIANNTFEVVTMQPGLLANGSPTTNAAASVDYLTISIDDDFGFAETTDPTTESANTFSTGSSQPGSGTYPLGYVVYNTVANNTVGWVCTDAGTPGSWSEF